MKVTDADCSKSTLVAISKFMVVLEDSLMNLLKVLDSLHIRYLSHTDAHVGPYDLSC